MSNNDINGNASPENSPPAPAGRTEPKLNDRAQARRRRETVKHLAVTGLLTAVVLFAAVLVFKGINDWVDSVNYIADEKKERAELQRCRLEQYITDRTGRAVLETVDLGMKKTSTGTEIKGDGLVLYTDVDPLDVYVTDNSKCDSVLSSEHNDKPTRQRCRIEQYLLEHLPPNQQTAAIPADLDLSIKNDYGGTVIIINGHTAMRNVDAAAVLSRHETCDP